MTREEIIKELEARERRQKELMEELDWPTCFGACGEATAAAVLNNNRRMGELIAMLRRIDKSAA